VSCPATGEGVNAISNAGTGVSRGGHGAHCLNLTTLDIEAQRTFDKKRKPLLLKVDCEGNELVTFKGAATLLSMVPPPVVTFEVIRPAQHLPPIKHFLESYGYAIYSIWAGDSGCVAGSACPTARSAGTYFETLSETIPHAVEVVALHLKTIHHSLWRGVFDHDRVVQISKNISKVAV